MLKNVHKSWTLSLQEIGMAKTFIATHDLWPEGASMPQTDCIIGLRSKYHPATHQPQPFQTPNHLELHACVKVMNVVSSLHDPNFTTARSMAWFQSAATLFTISAEYAEASAWQFRHHIARPCHLHIRNTSNLAILQLGRVARSLMRLGSLHSDIVAMQPQMGQHPVDSQRRSQSLDSTDDSKSLYLRTACCKNSNHERVQKENRTLFGLHGLSTLTMRIHCNPSKSLKPSNEVDIQNTEKRSFYILGDTQSNLHQFTCPGEITSL